MTTYLLTPLSCFVYKIIKYLIHNCIKYIYITTGNFKEAYQLVSTFDKHFCIKYNCTTNYTSWSIQSQLLHICAQMVRNKIIEDVHAVRFFGLMCDKAR